MKPDLKKRLSVLKRKDEENMHKKVETNLNFVEREREIAAYWKEHEVFRKTSEKNEGGESFAFYDGPPTANGKPHIGHILTRVMKDLIALLDPKYIEVWGRFLPRGGISIDPYCNWGKPPMTILYLFTGLTIAIARENRIIEASLTPISSAASREDSAAILSWFRIK